MSKQAEKLVRLQARQVVAHTVVSAVVAPDGFIEFHSAENSILADNRPDVSQRPTITSVDHHSLADVASRYDLRIIGDLNRICGNGKGVNRLQFHSLICAFLRCSTTTALH